MLHLIALLTLSLGSGLAFAKCELNQVSTMRRTTFGINFNAGSSFEEGVTVNIPLVIDGKQACYKKTSSIKVKTEKVADGEYIEYDIAPLQSEFMYVPTPSVQQFLFVDLDQGTNSSKIYMAGFLCSGERPIGGDAFSDSLLRIAETSEENESSTTIFIATGSAAENVSVSEEQKAKAKVFDKFLELYEKEAGIGPVDNDLSNIYVPNVLAGISFQHNGTIDRKLYSAFFSQTSSSINGCSKKFLTAMKPYLLENVAKSKPFKGIEISKKFLSNKYRLKWML